MVRLLIFNQTLLLSWARCLTPTWGWGGATDRKVAVSGLPRPVACGRASQSCAYMWDHSSDCAGHFFFLSSGPYWGGGGNR